MDIFTTTVYQSLTLKQGADIAIKHRLYISGWALSRTLQKLRTTSCTHDRIAIGSLNDIPVAIAILYEGGAQAFCRKKHRRNGYAGACVRALRSRMMVASIGIHGSEHFWSRHNVTLV